MYKNYSKFAHRYRISKRKNGPKRFGLYGKMNAENTQALQLKKLQVKNK